MDLKQQAAQQALEYVHDGMSLGLGTGSTTTIFIQLLGERLRRGELRDVCGVPTSTETARLAQAAGIPLISLADRSELDLAVDGADEIDPDLNLIKGLGKALLREKIIEIHARQFVVIADESKLVPRLGRGPLPVEIVPFEWQAHVRWLASLGCRAELWRSEDVGGAPHVTDNGNYLARCWFPDGIASPDRLAAALAERPGIVEHGLFLRMASRAVVAGKAGLHILERSE